MNEHKLFVTVRTVKLLWNRLRISHFVFGVFALFAVEKKSSSVVSDMKCANVFVNSSTTASLTHSLACVCCSSMGHKIRILVKFES